MCIDMGMRFPMSFSHKNLPGTYPVVFLGTSIGMLMYSGNKFFENSSCSKFGHTENSQENAGSVLPK